MDLKRTYRIAVTGPESTGKSALAEALAKHFKTLWVPEYSREYLNALARKYNYNDILSIAKGQFAREIELSGGAGNFLFCDTEFIVSKIWCEDKFGKCHPWILEMIDNHPYDLYLLCSIDLPWEPDPLRENPNDRERLFSLYLKELAGRQLNYKIISGQGEERLDHAIYAINDQFIFRIKQ